MWYTVLHGETPIGVVDLPLVGFTAAPMYPLPGYAEIQRTTQAATNALLEAGLFGATLPPLPPFPRDIIRLRRAMARAARLELSLVNHSGARVHSSFVNVLEAPHDGRVIVVAAFPSAGALAGAVTTPAPVSPGTSS
jgi:hypothetical protein